jgi:DNA helicase-2/ATP-dependent DNA helicase PcrA
MSNLRSNKIKLNSEQLKAVEQLEGPTIILAGAGTGKTFTIVEKIKHLIESKLYKPEEILCLTFSNEATNSLKEKILKSINTLTTPTIKTFHGFCADILRNEYNLLNINENFKIVTPDDLKIILTLKFNISPYLSNRYISSISTIKDFGISKKEIENYFLKLKKELEKISNTEIDKIEKIVSEKKIFLKTNYENSKEHKEKKKQIKKFLDLYDEFKLFEDFLTIWDKLEEMKKEKNYLDYGDLNLLVLELFEKYNLEKYSSKYKYIIVDEFQDTNKIQFKIIEHLGKKHKNITVVGDPNQSIYGFRGSYKESFNHFMKTFKATDKNKINLTKSFRSTNSILEIAHRLIKNNYENEKDCFKTYNAENIKGDKVSIIETLNYDEEIRHITEVIEEKLKNGVKPEEICILYRTHKQGKKISEYLKSKNIKFLQIEKSNLLNKKEIKTTIAYLNLLNSFRNKDELSKQAFWNLFYYKNLIPLIDSYKISKFLKEKNISYNEFIFNEYKKVDISENSKKIISNIIKKVKLLYENSNQDLDEIIFQTYEIIGLNKIFSINSDEKNIQSLLNMKRFYEIAKNFKEIYEDDLDKFLRYLEIINDLGINIETKEIKDKNAIRLMTIHASKGLEFEYVFVTNLANKRFPVSRTQNEPLIPKELLPDLKKFFEGNKSKKELKEIIKEYEKEILLLEERRLAYVAFTRAKKKLYLTFSKSYNEVENSTDYSTFLEEIGYLEFLKKENYKDDFLELIIDENLKGFNQINIDKKEIFLDKIKKEIISALDDENVDYVLDKISEYKTIQNEKVINLNNCDENHLKNLIDKTKNDSVKFNLDKSSIVLSPSAISDYLDCPKKFEFSRILNLPTFKTMDSSAKIGSFIHSILEYGVNNNFKSKKEYLDYAKKEMENFEDEINEMDVCEMIEVFWERNKNKIGPNSKTEVDLFLELEGFKFFGKADRIDFLKDGEIEIVDYKTNKNAITPLKRQIQLGYYALAAKESLKLEPKKLTLDMLKLEKPVEMKIEGNLVKGINSRIQPFDLEKLRKWFIEIANNIERDFKKGEFKTTKDESKCKFCSFKFYCPRWEEE